MPIRLLEKSICWHSNYGSKNILNRITGKFILKQGDIISVTVKNNSKTLSQVLKSFYYNSTTGDLHIIAASSSGTININGAT